MPYEFFIWVIQNLGSLIVAIVIAAFLFSDDVVEFFREADVDCPKQWPSIPEVVLKLVLTGLAAIISHQILSVEILAVMLSILLVPLVGLILVATIFNTFELDSIRLFWLITLGDIVGIVAILLLGLMIASMDQSMFMVNAALVLAVIYLIIKLAVHYDKQTPNP